MPRKDARNPQKQTTWSKLKYLLSGESSTRSVKQTNASSGGTNAWPTPQSGQEFVGSRDLDELQAAQYKRSKESQTKSTDNSHARNETADFLAAGTHLQHPAKAAVRQKAKVDHRHDPTPGNGSSHVKAVHSDPRTQKHGNYVYKPPPGPIAPARKAIKQERTNEVPTNNLRKVNERKPAVVYQAPKRHVSTQVVHDAPTAPVSPLTPGHTATKGSRPVSPLTPGNRGTTWEYFSSRSQQVSPLHTPIPPVPIVPESVRAQKSRERWTRKQVPPSQLPNAAKVHEHRRQVDRARKAPQCRLCEKDSVPDLQVDRSGHGPQCEGCARRTFRDLSAPNPSFSYAQPRPDSPTLSEQPSIRQQQPPKAGHYADFDSSIDPQQAANAYSPPARRSIREQPKKERRYQEAGANFRTPWIESPAPSPFSSQNPSNPSPSQNPLNPSLHQNSDGPRKFYTYSTIMARTGVESAPPLPAIPSNVQQASSSSRPRPKRRPSSRYSQEVAEPSYRYSQAMGAGYLPPKSMDQTSGTPPSSPPPTLLPSSRRQQKSSTRAPPSIPPVKCHSPLPVPSDSPDTPTSAYKPIRWRTDKAKTSPLAAPATNTGIKRKPVPQAAAGFATTSSQWTQYPGRSTAFYENWGPIMGFETAGEQEQKSRRY